MSSTCARTSWPAPTTGSPRRAISISAAWISIRRFAPAWAHLGRCHRVIGKFIDGTPDSEARAEEALRRALELEPAPLGGAQVLRQPRGRHRPGAAGAGAPARARPAVTATIRSCSPDSSTRAATADSSRQSIAAHAEARRLDPNVPTSLEQTLLMTGDIDRLLAIEPPPVVAGADDGIRVIGLGLAGRRDEARAALAEMRQVSRIHVFQSWTDYLMAWLDRRPRGHARPACPRSAR